MIETESTDRNSGERGRRNLWLVIGLALLVSAGLLGLGAVTAPPAEAGPWLGHGGFGHGGGPGHAGGEMDPEQLRYAAGWILGRVDASDEQLDAIVTIASEAHEELRGLRGQHDGLREAFEAAMTAQEVDREALENLRRQAMDAGEAASQRMVQAIGDAAAVLTQEQRQALLEEHRQGRHHFGGRRFGRRHFGH